VKQFNKMKKGSFLLVVLTVLFIISCDNSSLQYEDDTTLAPNFPLQIGWAIGFDASYTAVILHTKNGGQKWVVQGDNTKWESCYGNDISAVDEHTAWAALGSNTSDGSGKILHTTNGGATWIEQTLPEGVDGGIKGIKGLTRDEAWAVSITGTILHTTDGGKVWNIVEHPNFEIGQVNRMDAIGYRDVRDTDSSGKNTGKVHANVWIADHEGEDEGHLGMIHTLYNGDIWRQEYLPATSDTDFRVHMVSAYSPRVAWAAAWLSGALYRTVDGGENWKIEAEVGPNDIDDMCAYSADALWFVQFQGTQVGGIIYHLYPEDEEVEIEQFNPFPSYQYEGLTCANDQAAVVVGFTKANEPPQQRGIILVTNDGGQTWENQPLPVDDVSLWKVSFVGARR
jgi:photosystem II stability/assembly factor-like uncharacterized protein